MQYALFLPYWLWGFVCGAFAVMVLLYGLRTFWGRQALKHHLGRYSRIWV